MQRNQGVQSAYSNRRSVLERSFAATNPWWNLNPLGLLHAGIGTGRRERCKRLIFFVLSHYSIVSVSSSLLKIQLGNCDINEWVDRCKSACVNSLLAFFFKLYLRVLVWVQIQVDCMYACGVILTVIIYYLHYYVLHCPVQAQVWGASMTLRNTAL